MIKCKDYFILLGSRWTRVSVNLNIVRWSNVNRFWKQNRPVDQEQQQKILTVINRWDFLPAWKNGQTVTLSYKYFEFRSKFFALIRSPTSWIRKCPVHFDHDCYDTASRFDEKYTSTTVSRLFKLSELRTCFRNFDFHLQTMYM